MTWTPRLEHFFPRGSVSKGQSYFRTGAVQIENFTDVYVRATVKGSGWYSVVLDVDLAGEVLAVSCTCPYFDEDVNFCKHIWATMLEAESKGHLQKISEMQHPALQADYEDHEWKTERPPPEQPPKYLSPPSWRQQLTSVRPLLPLETIEISEGKRRIVYVADAAQTVSTRGLVIQAASSRCKRSGEWGKPAFQESSIKQVQQLDLADQRILALLSGSEEVSGYMYSLREERDSIRSRHRVPPAAQDVIAPILCETERFFVKPPKSDALFPMKWDSGPPWSFRVEVGRDDAAAEYVIKGVLQRDGRDRPLTEPLLLVEKLVFFRDNVARLDHGNLFPWIGMLRRSGELRVPFAQREELVHEIADFPVVPFLDLPEELRVESLTLTNPPELLIRPMPDQGWKTSQKLACWVTFDYAGVKIPATQIAASIHDQQSNRYYKRDLKAERAALHRLSTLGFSRVMWQKHQLELPPARLPAAVRVLVSEGWRVEAEGKLYRRAGNFEVKVASGVDWFELHGRADFEGQLIDIPQLLKAVARGENMVLLDDGTYGLVPEDWLKRYRFVASLGKSDNGEIRFERRQAALLDALLAEQPEVLFDEGFERMREEIAAFSGVRPVQESAAFNGELRDYQREGLGWLQFLRR